MINVLWFNAFSTGEAWCIRSKSSRHDTFCPLTFSNSREEKLLQQFNWKNNGKTIWRSHGGGIRLLGLTDMPQHRPTKAIFSYKISNASRGWNKNEDYRSRRITRFINHYFTLVASKLLPHSFSFSLVCRLFKVRHVTSVVKDAPVWDGNRWRAASVTFCPLCVDWR